MSEDWTAVGRSSSRSSDRRGGRSDRGNGQGRGGRYCGRGRYGGRGGSRPNRLRNPINVARFTGGSSDILWHIFQTSEEQRKRGQFKDTLDMMMIYTSRNMQKEMDMLSCLFNNKITSPEVMEPDEPIVKVGKSKLTKAQTSIYNARVNLFIKEERSLKSVIIALYNVTWGQCSPMMQNHLELLAGYGPMRKDSDIEGNQRS